ncbi:MAG: glutaryl-CoA dehydrogenase [Actinomycetota bacterium]|jgi:glutaryl-CoA dehydrogenase|nr:MAG: glutaryl-CoA dehydrogenase [Actinomycetota bacterium]
MPSAAPDPLDLLDLDALLSEEERQVRDLARSWVRERVLPELEEWFERGVFPAREIAKELGQLGFLGMQLPDESGSPTVGPVGYGLAELELEAGDSGLRSFVSVQSALAMFAIHAFGSDEQRAEWLPPMRAGEAIGCFGLSEPDAGSDPGSMRTRARRDGGDWVLSGTKMWITNGSCADVAIVWAHTDEGIRGFVVPTDRPGVRAFDIHRKLSLRASVTSELAFDDVRLPGDAVLPGAHGLKGPLSCLNEARYGIVWGVMGAARACLDAALNYSRERIQFDRPIASFQLTQKKLADMALAVATGTLLALHLGRMKEAGRLRPEQVSVGKLNNTRAALEVARTARSILGANGITLEYPVMRHMTNLESVLTYEGTEEVHTLVVGQTLTGIRAFS